MSPSPHRSLPTALLAAVFTLHSSALIRAQGLLTPPGVPAPTMKTLQQIEPRIDLQNAPASAVTTGNANYHFIITQPGSYYLSANLGVTKTNGIQINAEGVTLDLSGFEISRASGTAGSGIEILGGSHRASVRNGTLKGFSNGILIVFSGNYPTGCAFRDLGVSACTTLGISAGDGAMLESCRAHNNSGSYGIFASTGSTLINCSVFNNTVTYGIYAFSGSSLVNCTAFSNSSASAASSGIETGDNCTLTGCTVRSTNSTSVALSSSTGIGIRTGNRCTITGCNSNGNTGDGILTGTGSTVTGCTANTNGNGTVGSGIVLGNNSKVVGSTTASNKANGIHTGDGVAITQCTANENSGRGILASNGCSITRNLTRSNAADGIFANYSCQIEGNNSNGDGTSAGPWAGINVVGQANRVDGNNVTYPSKTGILVTQGANVIIRNTAKGGTPNFSIAADNVYGPIIDRTAPASAAVSGNSAPGSAGTTDPLANIAF